MAGGFLEARLRGSLKISRAVRSRRGELRESLPGLRSWSAPQRRGRAPPRGGRNHLGFFLVVGTLFLKSAALLLLAPRAQKTVDRSCGLGYFFVTPLIFSPHHRVYTTCHRALISGLIYPIRTLLLRSCWSRGWSAGYGRATSGKRVRHFRRHVVQLYVRTAIVIALGLCSGFVCVLVRTPSRMPQRCVFVIFLVKRECSPVLAVRHLVGTPSSLDLPFGAGALRFSFVVSPPVSPRRSLFAYAIVPGIGPIPGIFPTDPARPVLR